MKKMIILFLCSLLLVITSCGQSGRLYLPDQNTTNTSTSKHP